MTPSNTRDYGALLRRSWWILLLGFVIGGAAAFAFSSSMEKRYTTDASLSFQDLKDQSALVGAPTTQNYETPADLAAKSAAILDEDGVLQEALSRAKSARSVRWLRDHSTVTV